MKKLLILALAFAMLLTLAAGCTQPTTAPTTGTTGTGATTAAPTTTQGPPAKIVYMYPAGGGAPVDLEKVNQAVSEYTIAKINVDPTMMPVAIANYSQQAMLMITGREDLDLMTTMPGGPTLFSSLIANNQIKDITDLVPQYAQGIVDAIEAVNPGYVAGTTIEGKTYGFTCLFNKVSNTYVSIRKDMLDKYNLDLTAARNGTDLEAIIKTLAENESIPVLAAQTTNGDVLTTGAMVVNYNNFAERIPVEFFGNDVWLFGAILGTDNTNVINYYESDLFRSQADMTHRWYNAGYINRDSATQTETSIDIMKGNGALATLGAGEMGHEVSMNNRVGMELVTIKIAEGLVNSGMVQKFSWVVPVTCDEDEAALKFLNLTYTDADLVNLINYGIEGEHYVLDDQGRIKLPEGITSQNNPYNVNASYLFGSQFLAKVWNTDPADMREQALAINKAAVVAPLMGYTVRTQGIADEMTAVRGVIDQYRPGLVAGSSNPDTVMPQFLAALNSAGINTIIAEVQSQVDAFVANR